MGSASVKHVSSLRCEVQKLLEWQRHHQHSKIAASEDATASNDDAKDENKPSIDAHAALQAAFDVLLQKNSHDNAQSSTAESDAFRIVTMVVQLEDLTLLPEEQTKIAEIVHQLWFSTSPGVACRTLLEDMLARKGNDTAVFVDQLLRILQQTFTVGNKRSLQILIHLFDVVDNSLLEDCFPDLVDKLAECITTQSGAQQAARILSKVALVRSGHDTKVLLDFLKPFIIQESHRAKQAVYENLLPPILSQVPELQPPLLQWLQESACTSTNHLYALLVLARLCPPSEAGSDNNVSEYDDLISPSLVHEDALIRFEAFRLLSTLPYGPSPSRRFHLPHLALHSMFWKYNLTDSDSPAVRTGLIGEWKQFIIRARLSSNAARRIVVKYQKRPEGEVVHPDVVEAQQYIDAVQASFVDWTASTTRQLIPVKPYRCQISALLFLQILLEHGLDTRYAIGSSTASTKAGRAKEAITWPFEVRIVNRSFTESLITCIRSTYEDIRNLAHAILANITLEADHLQLVRDLGFLLVQRKREADIASGTLHLRLISTAGSSMSEYDMLGSIIPHLLGLLEMRLEAFRTSLAEAADQSPVHGIFQSIA